MQQKMGYPAIHENAQQKNAWIILFSFPLYGSRIKAPTQLLQGIVKYPMTNLCYSPKRESESSDGIFSNYLLVYTLNTRYMDVKQNKK